MTQYTVNIYNWSGTTTVVSLYVSYKDSAGDGKSSRSPNESLSPGSNLTDPSYTYQFTVDTLNWANLYIKQPQDNLNYTIIPNSSDVFNVWILDDPDFASLTRGQATSFYLTANPPPSNSYIVQGAQYMAASKYTFPTSGVILLTAGPALDTLTEVDTFTTTTTTTTQTGSSACSTCTDCSKCPDCPSCTDDDSTSWTWLWWTLGVLAIILLVVVTGYLIWRKRRSSVEVAEDDQASSEALVY